MQRWEYARFIWGGEEARDPRRVGFTYGDPWSVGSDDFWATMRRLGDEGWELISTAKIAGSSERPYTESWIMYFKRPAAEASSASSTT